MEATHKYMVMCMDEYIRTDSWDVAMHWFAGHCDRPDIPVLWVRYGDAYFAMPEHLEHLTLKALGKF